MTRTVLTFEQDLNRLAAYQVLEPWLRDARVLELGCGEGHGLRQLFALGARAVVGLDRDVRRARPRVAALEEVVTLRGFQPPRLDLQGASFDVIIVNEVAAILGPSGRLGELRAALSPEGMLVVRAESGDHTGDARGVTYGELLDLLEPVFPVVRVFGQSPFVGYSVAELTGRDGAELDLFVDGALMGGAVEEVTSYLVLCGSKAAFGQEGAYGILQVPSEGDAALERWWDSLGGQTEGETGGRVPSHVEAPAQQDAATGGYLEAVGPLEPGKLAESAPSQGASSPRQGQEAGSEPEAQRGAVGEAGGPGDKGIDLGPLTDSQGGRIARWRWPVGG